MGVIKSTERAVASTIPSHSVSTGQNGRVWVWLGRDETRRLTPGTMACLYEGGALARRLGATLTAVGDLPPSDEETSLLATWGVGAVKVLGLVQPSHPIISGGKSPLAPLLNVDMASSGGPWVTLFPGETFGRVAAPLWAAEVGGEYLAGVSGITVDRGMGEFGKGRKSGGIVAVRSVMGGQVEAVIRPGGERPVVATLAKDAVGEPSPPQGLHSQGTALVVESEGSSLNSLPIAGSNSLIPPDPETVDLEDAERIVAFGRGAFTPEGQALAEQLAKALGAVVAGTRPAADEGRLPFSRQVGLTGAIVRPKLYVALGISGAPYHMVGIKDPETLVAVNIDPEAPILSQAHLGIVGDLHTVVPALLERLERGDTLEGIAGKTGEEGT